MKPKDFVTKYNLDKGWKKSYQENFLSDFTFEFVALLEYNKATGNLKGFDNALRSAKQKWDSISNKTSFGLPEGLWRYYFATTVAPMREEMCKEQMQARREEQKRRRERRELYDRLLEEEKARFREAHKSFFEYLLKFITFRTIPTESFEFMGLPFTATEDDIRKRYREMCLTMHPDKGGKQEDFLMLLTNKNKCLKWVNDRNK